MNDVYYDTAGRYLKVRSDSAYSHKPEFEATRYKMPTIVWSQAGIYGEIAANTANLQAITRLCSQGKMATKILGELMGDDVIGAIDPDDTIIE